MSNGSARAVPKSPYPHKSAEPEAIWRFGNLKFFITNQKLIWRVIRITENNLHHFVNNYLNKIIEMRMKLVKISTRNPSEKYSNNTQK